MNRSVAVPQASASAPWPTVVKPSQPVFDVSLTVIIIATCFFGSKLSKGLRKTVTGLCQQRQRDSGIQGTHTIPQKDHWIPCVGHLLQLHCQSARYLHSLLLQCPLPVFVIDALVTRVILVRPSLNKALARHMSATSLSKILSTVGSPMFGLSRETVDLISAHDSRPQHRHELMESTGAESLRLRATLHVFKQVQGDEEETEVAIGRWLFGKTAGAIASAIWGPQNPWHEDEDFSQKFIEYAESFDASARPSRLFFKSRAAGLREDLVKRLRAYHAEHLGSRRNCAQHRMNLVATYGDGGDEDDDYFRVELIQALGFLVTPSVLTGWMMRHLLARPDVLTRVVQEVDDIPRDSSGRLDMPKLWSTAPTVVASWYETLRLHMTGVPRVARHDFALAQSSSEPGYSVREGDILMLPMYSINHDAAVFGPDVDEFRPERLMDGQGKLRQGLVRKIACFGVAGNLCPGRKLGMETALALMAETLSRYTVDSVDGREFRVPAVARGIAVGFDRYKTDVRVRMTARKR